MRLFPKEIDFFEIFEKASQNLINTASLLLKLLENIDTLETKAKEIYEAEQEGDILTHEIMKKLNKTFITPIDSEDLYDLASRLDDVIDLIWGVVKRLMVFKIKEIMPPAVLMAKNLLETTEVMHKAIIKLREKNYLHVQEYCIEINRIENRIDRDFRDALGDLFDRIHDPIQIIKCKEIYEYLENASDRCEDVANIIEGIVLKYA